MISYEVPQLWLFFILFDLSDIFLRVEESDVDCNIMKMFNWKTRESVRIYSGRTQAFTQSGGQVGGEVTGQLAPSLD